MLTIFMQSFVEEATEFAVTLVRKAALAELSLNGSPKLSIKYASSTHALLHKPRGVLDATGSGVVPDHFLQQMQSSAAGQTGGDHPSGDAHQGSGGADSKKRKKSTTWVKKAGPQGTNPSSPAKAGSRRGGEKSHSPLSSPRKKMQAGQGDGGDKLQSEPLCVAHETGIHNAPKPIIYSKNGITYEFANDKNRMELLGSHENCFRLWSHRMKGLKTIARQPVGFLSHLPSCMVEYAGYRVWCQAAVPLQAGSFRPSATSLFETHADDAAHGGAVLSDRDTAVAAVWSGCIPDQGATPNVDTVVYGSDIQRHITLSKAEVSQDGVGGGSSSPPAASIVDHTHQAASSQVLLTSELDFLAGHIGSTSASVLPMFHRDGRQATAAMRTLSTKLNLKPHFVGAGPGRQFLYTNGDLCLRQGFENQFYVVSGMERVMPAITTNNIVHRNGYLTRRFRHEFVLKSKKSKSQSMPISSDVFSPFGLERCDEHDREAALLTAILKNQLLTDGTNKLLSAVFKCRGVAQGFEVIEARGGVEALLHRHGINMRYLGEMTTRLCQRYYKIRAKHVSADNVEYLLLISITIVILRHEMIARALKIVVRRLMRNRSWEDIGAFLFAALHWTPPKLQSSSNSAMLSRAREELARVKKKKAADAAAEEKQQGGHEQQGGGPTFVVEASDEKDKQQQKDTEDADEALAMEESIASLSRSAILGKLSSRSSSTVSKKSGESSTTASFITVGKKKKGGVHGARKEDATLEEALKQQARAQLRDGAQCFELCVWPVLEAKYALDESTTMVKFSPTTISTLSSMEEDAFNIPYIVKYVVQSTGVLFARVPKPKQTFFGGASSSGGGSPGHRGSSGKSGAAKRPSVAGGGGTPSSPTSMTARVTVEEAPAPWALSDLTSVTREEFIGELVFVWEKVKKDYHYAQQRQLEQRQQQQLSNAGSPQQPLTSQPGSSFPGIPTPGLGTAGDTSSASVTQSSLRPIFVESSGDPHQQQNKTSTPSNTTLAMTIKRSLLEYFPFVAIDPKPVVSVLPVPQALFVKGEQSHYMGVARSFIRDLTVAEKHGYLAAESLLGKRGSPMAVVLPDVSGRADIPHLFELGKLCGMYCFYTNLTTDEVVNEFQAKHGLRHLLGTGCDQGDHSKHMSKDGAVKGEGKLITGTGTTSLTSPIKRANAKTGAGGGDDPKSRANRIINESIEEAADLPDNILLFPIQRGDVIRLDKTDKLLEPFQLAHGQWIEIKTTAGSKSPSSKGDEDGPIFKRCIALGVNNGFLWGV